MVIVIGEGEEGWVIRAEREVWTESEDLELFWMGVEEDEEVW